MNQLASDRPSTTVGVLSDDELRGIDAYCHRLEGSWRAHQIPIPDVFESAAHLKMLDAWMRAYHPEELFDHEGRLVPRLKNLAPRGARRMSANPTPFHAAGSKAPDLDKPSSSRWKYTMPAYGCQCSTALPTPR
jgi:xylulose-5-phosphate/fructose-6-phosphate phosphoketolase